MVLSSLSYLGTGASKVIATISKWEAAFKALRVQFANAIQSNRLCNPTPMPANRNRLYNPTGTANWNCLCNPTGTAYVIQLKPPL